MLTNDLPMDRRLRIARKLAGVRSFEELSDAIRNAGHGRGYGTRTLRKFADDDDPRSVDKRDAGVLADALGVPAEFFLAAPDEALALLADATGQTVDFLLGLAPPGAEIIAPVATRPTRTIAELEERLATVEDALTRVLEAVPIPGPPVGLLPRREAETTTPEESRPPGKAAGGSRRGSGR